MHFASSVLPQTAHLFWLSKLNVASWLEFQGLPLSQYRRSPFRAFHQRVGRGGGLTFIVGMFWHDVIISFFTLSSYHIIENSCSFAFTKYLGHGFCAANILTIIILCQVNQCHARDISVTCSIHTSKQCCDCKFSFLSHMADSVKESDLVSCCWYL